MEIFKENEHCVKKKTKKKVLYMQSKYYFTFLKATIHGFGNNCVDKKCFNCLLLVLFWKSIMQMQNLFK